ncbi:hypothetical protein L6452_42715 [Arctium lappa]|uniref:Uncharacterized protein n=1 Tax=Arctium lappa TaxID=4217 RepID=A0ACB8XIZ1_ARCLA|nr:hypothetical protein L6452_42715 [Arctium lappa]
MRMKSIAGTKARRVLRRPNFNSEGLIFVRVNIHSFTPPFPHFCYIAPGGDLRTLEEEIEAPEEQRRKGESGAS